MEITMKKEMFFIFYSTIITNLTKSFFNTFIYPSAYF